MYLEQWLTLCVVFSAVCEICGVVKMRPEWTQCVFRFHKWLDKTDDPGTGFGSQTVVDITLAVGSFVAIEFNLKILLRDSGAGKHLAEVVMFGDPFLALLTTVDGGDIR